MKELVFNKIKTGHEIDINADQYNLTLTVSTIFIEIFLFFLNFCREKLFDSLN
jgi:hypothetical protein